jgi:hypothetical protein
MVMHVQVLVLVLLGSVVLSSSLSFGTKEGLPGQLADASFGAKRDESIVPKKGRKTLVAGLAYGAEYGKFLMRKFVGTLRFTG